jgi:hypothetical protein
MSARIWESTVSEIQHDVLECLTDAEIQRKLSEIAKDKLGNVPGKVYRDVFELFNIQKVVASKKE